MLKSIQKNLSKLSNEELISLNHMVVDMLKSNRRSESFQKGLSLRPGQEVEINHPKHRGEKFVIKKVNRTRCKVVSKTNLLGSYNVPMSMIIS